MNARTTGTVDAGGLRRMPTSAPTVGRVMPRIEAPVAGGAHRRSSATADACRTGPLRAAGASLVGASHRQAGTGRQDAFTICSPQQGTLVVGVADGLGSRINSQVGAQAFCDCLAALSAPVVTTAAELLQDAAERTRASVEGLGVEPGSSGFVAVVAVVGPGGVDLARVGDCSAFVMDAGRFDELFSAPEGAVNTLSSAYPDAGSADVEVAHLPSLPAVLVVVSDGVSTDLRTSPGVREWLMDTWRGPVDELLVLDALRYERRGSSDDRTAVVVWCGADGTSVLPDDELLLHGDG